jgi:hypothetical protein
VVTGAGVGMGLGRRALLVLLGLVLAVKKPRKWDQLGKRMHRL